MMLIPADDFISWLDGMWITQREDRMYWHISIGKHGGKLTLRRKKDIAPIDRTAYLLPIQVQDETAAIRASSASRVLIPPVAGHVQ